MSFRRGLAVAGAVLLFGAVAVGLQAAAIPAKAALAQVLLRDAWLRAQEGERAPRPWAWADAWPVAHLRLPRGEYIVLAGTQGSALAFAPTWVQASAPPGAAGTTVIAAHRDTHFQGLGALRVGDRLTLGTAIGEVVAYRVLGAEVHDLARNPLLTLREDGQRYLVLVTCYPFAGTATASSQRYVVWARADEP